MNAADARALAQAIRQIKARGQLVQWIKIRDGLPPDPSKPFNPGASIPTPYDCYILFLPSNRKTVHGQAYSPLSDIPQGFIRALMAGGQQFSPVLKDTVQRDLEILNVEYVDVLNPAGTPLLWYLGFLP